MSIYYFFIGTEAELIKLLPLIRRMEEKKEKYFIIASGQNEIKSSRVLLVANGGRLDQQLSEERNIKKNASGLLSWYMKTRSIAKKRFIQQFGKPELDDVMIVHGDTVSTVMGAWLGRRLGMRVAHIEAGLRSFRWFSPFPEEIDRMLVSRAADIHFAPTEQAAQNLKNKKQVICTHGNTLKDSLAIAYTLPCENEQIRRVAEEEDYFVFVLHRQENLSNDRLIEVILREVWHASHQYKCVLILHKITEIKFRQMGVLERMTTDEHFIIFPRVDYFDFMKLLQKAQFVITDGGSNQEELSYMGVPTLILRETTERSEGIGENAVLLGKEIEKAGAFIRQYPDFRRSTADASEGVSPSEIICKYLRNEK